MAEVHLPLVLSLSGGSALVLWRGMEVKVSVEGFGKGGRPRSSIMLPPSSRNTNHAIRSSLLPPVCFPILIKQTVFALVVRVYRPQSDRRQPDVVPAASCPDEKESPAHHKSDVEPVSASLPCTVATSDAYMASQPHDPPCCFVK